MDSNLKRSFGAVIRKKGSKRLHLKTYFFSQPFEYASGLPDTPDNKAQLEEFMRQVMTKHYAGELKFNKAFPKAKPEVKLWYAEKSARLYDLKRQDVSVSTLITEMKETFIKMIKKQGTQDDYLNAINARVLPFFEEHGMTFADISTDCMLKLAKSFYKKNNGAPLSSSRIDKIITALRMVIKYANTKYGWQAMPDPFWIIKKVAEVAEIQDSTRVLRYEEFMRILAAVDKINPWYRPIIELMILTGMIPSEIAGLKQKSISSTFIMVKTFVVNGAEKSGGKTYFRKRKIPITSSVRRVLDELINRQSGSEFLVTMVDGKALSADKFRNNIWTPALEKAGVDYERPYCLRHSFIAWSLLAGMDPYVLYPVAGHRSKRMIYEVYGDYVDGIENDRPNIIEYLGADFVSENKRLHR